MKLKPEQAAQLDQLINEKAITADGFRTADAEVLMWLKSAQHRFARRFAAGTLFRAKLAGSSGFAYFLTQTLADALPRPTKAESKPSGGWGKQKFVVRITRKSSTPKPRQAATIIYPPSYKHSYHPMPVPRTQAVTHSFIHSGMRAM
ncbi:hypothetical protein [Polaromonas sp.]|uniref:hypothetical protein n=1 Tax=Polaromonas sp. TaxID=1869339 RepID=UPI0017A8B01B|nr:hypothetical protein [Polaromonas sp.]NML86383.1 hypothetical protein [Polaromonas sp.]